MNRLARTVRPVFCALFSIAGHACWAQQAVHPLPQAFPGASYAAQLAIPPGLGYPFAKCELSRESPRWLVLDCARLQLKGKVPAASAGDAVYQVVLKLEDGAGNSRSFPLSLRISSRPEVVNLAEPEVAPDAGRPAEVHASLSNRLAPPGPPPTPLEENRGEHAAEAGGTAMPAAGSLPRQGNQDGIAASASAAEANGATPAAELSSAAARLRDADITRTKPPAVRGNALASRAKPAGLHAEFGSTNCVDAVPAAGAESVAQESDATKDLKAAVANCAQTKNVACPASYKALAKSAAQAQIETAGCANGGTVSSGGSVISDTAQAWYKSRSDLWGELTKDVKAQLTQKDPASSPLPKDLVTDLENPAATPTSSPAGSEFNLGLARYYFVGGTLLSQQQDQFSHADLFLGFHLDRVLRAPEGYIPLEVSAPKPGPSGAAPDADQAKAPSAIRYLAPGISTLLDIRLTSLPVSVQPCTPNTTGQGSAASNNCSNKSTGSSSASTTDQTQVFLNSQKAARLEGGVYLPYQLRRWQPSGATDGYVVDLAPIAKVGFDTSLNGLNQTQQSSNTPATVQPTGNSNSFYKFYDYGGRLIWSKVAQNRPMHGDAPELVGFLDVGLGRFSNMATLLCPAAQAPCTTNSGLNHQFQYRIAMEGLLDIPGAAGLTIGFSANLAQRGIGAHPYDLLPPDDLRFLFGYKVDVTKFFKKPAGF